MTSRLAVLRRSLGTVAAGCLVWALASCGGDGGPLPPLDEDYPPEMLQLGGEVYDDSCSQCHGRNGKGNVGPSLVGIGDRMTFEETCRELGVSEAELEQLVAAGEIASIKEEHGKQIEEMSEEHQRKYREETARSARLEADAKELLASIPADE